MNHLVNGCFYGANEKKKCIPISPTIQINIIFRLPQNYKSTHIHTHWHIHTIITIIQMESALILLGLYFV